jgi:rubrerythrin
MKYNFSLLLELESLSPIFSLTLSIFHLYFFLSIQLNIHQLRSQDVLNSSEIQEIKKGKTIMLYNFNADDIFEIAQQLEQNGAQFYRKAAASLKDNAARDFLFHLASMEEEHEKTFVQMRSQLKESEKSPTVFDPQGEAADYLKALADTRVFFEKKIDTSSLEEILKEAIIAEKDSIVFYLGMREAVPEKLGQTRLDVIIREEMGHIRQLSKELMARKK